MIKLRYDFEINAPPNEVWSVVSDLKNGYKWMPGIVSIDYNANIRTCRTSDGQEVVENITAFSDENRLFSYFQTKSSLPIDKVSGAIKISDYGYHTMVIWNMAFELLDPTRKNALIPMIDGYYMQTLKHLKNIIENKESMKEFMLFIQAEGNPVAALPESQQAEHVQKVGAYIEGLVKAGKMKSAQPLAMEGAIIKGENGIVSDGPFIETKEVIAGYYHLVAKDMEEAKAIAKADPRFEDGRWAIEIRPIMKIDGIN